MMSGTSVIEHLEGRLMFSETVTPIMDDKFDGTSVNTANWHIPKYDPSGSTYIPRTQFRVSDNAAPPPVSNGAVHMRVESYNPHGFSFYGDELISNKSFTVGTGLMYQAHVKLDAPIQGGVVGGIFFYMLKPGSNTLHDELDTELLSNQVVKGTNKVQTNAYANQPLGTGSPVFVPLPSGRKLTDYNWYKVKCYQNKVEFYVDGVLVRTSTTIVPTGPMQMYLNIWVPDSSWAAAYNAGIQPTSVKSQNKEFKMDVDEVIVSRLSNTTPVQPSIKITSVPSYGNTGFASGTVAGVTLSNYQGIAVYIKVGTGWWTKPTYVSPISGINSNGTWSANITTGGNDTQATEIRAYLIPNNFSVPIMSGQSTLPDSLSPLLKSIVTRSA